jgi:5-methyltetrahydropteroyltriglutamate--homocysteine methyltransferase
VPNTYYKTEDDYVEALAKAMKVEYDAVYKAGFVLQIDCPDLGSARGNQYRNLSDDEFLKIAARNVEAVNYATADIPPEAMRMHICWGNYEGPHVSDIPFAKIAPIVWKARPQGVSFEGANPRHEHEWEDLKEIGVPDNKVLIPGVIDSTCNFVEHPKLVAQRIGHYTDIVGRERVIAGVDCGFSTVAIGSTMVVPTVIWAKFRSLAEGAEIASKRLWR